MHEFDKESLKNEYGDRFEQDFVNYYNIRKKGKMYYCPYHNDKGNPNMSYDKDNFMFKCFNCGESADIYRLIEERENVTFPEAVNILANDLGYSIVTKCEIEDQRKEKIKKVKNKEITYLEKRGISFETCKKLGVKQLDNRIAYIHYNGDGEITGIKYRTIGDNVPKNKRFTSETGSFFGNLYNKINVKGKDKLYIVEGEIDCLTMTEIGFDNVVSVPSGAGAKDWLTNEYDFVSSFEEVYIAFDDDEAGKRAKREFTNRMETELIINIIQFESGLDINDQYRDYARKYYKTIKDENSDKKEIIKKCYEVSKEKVLKDIKKSKKHEIKDLTNFDDVKLERKSSPYMIRTGFEGIDNHLNGMRHQQLTIIGGREGEGKSTFLAQVIANVVDSGEKVFNYCGELSLEKYKRWIYTQVIGNDEKAFSLEKDYLHWIRVYKEGVKDTLEKWHKDKIYIYNSAMGTSHDKIFDKMIAAHKLYGIKIFIIDNLTSILKVEYQSKNLTETDFVTKLAQVKNKYGLHIILVTHPNKNNSEKGTLLHTNSISGSKNITDLADNVIVFMRIIKNEEGEMVLGGKTYTDGCTLRTDITKDRGIGKRVSHYYSFDENSKRFIEKIDNRFKSKNYRWKKFLSKDIDENYNYIKVTEEKAKQLRGEKEIDTEEYLF